jgi:hypothetical protein
VCILDIESTKVLMSIKCMSVPRLDMHQGFKTCYAPMYIIYYEASIHSLYNESIGAYYIPFSQVTLPGENPPVLPLILRITQGKT